MARSTFPTPAPNKTNFRLWLRQRLSQLLSRTALLQGEFIGSLHARRTEVRPFTPAQIKLIETFADQAVIAIENVRLFNELKESLEQQTATSEILGVIASSPTDIQPVLDVVAENAARLCERRRCSNPRVDGDMIWLAAHYGPMPSRERKTSLVDEPWVCGRAMIDDRRYISMISCRSR